MTAHRPQYEVFRVSVKGRGAKHAFDYIVTSYLEYDKDVVTDNFIYAEVWLIESQVQTIKENFKCFKGLKLEIVRCDTNND